MRCTLRLDEIIHHNFTVNGEHCTAMINEFFLPVLEDIDVDDLWFQHDGATYSKEKINLLKKTFILASCASHDLTPADYFLWGYAKSLVYVEKPAYEFILVSSAGRCVTCPRSFLNHNGKLNKAALFFL